MEKEINTPKRSLPAFKLPSIESAKLRPLRKSDVFPRKLNPSDLLNVPATRDRRRAKSVDERSIRLLSRSFDEKQQRLSFKKKTFGTVDDIIDSELALNLSKPIKKIPMMSDCMKRAMHTSDEKLAHWMKEAMKRSTDVATNGCYPDTIAIESSTRTSSKLWNTEISIIPELDPWIKSKKEKTKYVNESPLNTFTTPIFETPVLYENRWYNVAGVDMTEERKYSDTTVRLLQRSRQLSKTIENNKAFHSNLAGK